MDNIIFLVGAYAFIWLILAYYFFITGKKVDKLEKKLNIILEEKEENHKI